MSKSRIILMVVAIVVAFIGVAYLAFNSLTYFMYESRSCSWANIDNIELRTNIDIPKTLDCNCSYSKETDSKTAIFTLDLDSDAILDYAYKNGFKPVDLGDERSTFNDLNQNIVASPLLQRAEILPQRASYRFMLDPNAKKLYVSLTYLN